MEKELSNKNKIEMFLHCALCFKEKPDSISPRDFARLEVGWTVEGIQVWCVRHECNILHVDFESQTHPANTTREDEDEVLH